MPATTLCVEINLPVNYDGSGMGAGNDRETTTDDDDFVGSVQELNGTIIVRKLSMKQFRERLIRHFEIAFKKKEIQWPKARMMNTPEPTI
jgi:hypothetical protein